jgi:phosphoglycolate phosphatase-like HAD superfamily hydrolase
MKWQAVFWDFDGVVLDSVNVKTKAFSLMFKQYGPDVESAVVKYHLANGGISRFDKFRYVYNHLLNRSISEEELMILGNQFSSLVYQEVLSAPFIPGAFETLIRLYNKGIPSFVVSGTPEKELQQIVNAREIMHLFVEVHGSPREKSDIVIDILARNGYNPFDCLFLGDSMTDYEAAIKTGTDFIGIVLKDATSTFPAGTRIMAEVKLI